jgi:hypothetical protein
VATLFDHHLIGAPEDRQRYSKPERLRCLEIDDEFDFRRVLRRQIGWLFAKAEQGGQCIAERQGGKPLFSQEVRSLRRSERHPTGRGLMLCKRRLKLIIIARAHQFDFRGPANGP